MPEPFFRIFRITPGQHDGVRRRVVAEGSGEGELEVPEPQEAGDVDPGPVLAEHQACFFWVADVIFLGGGRRVMVHLESRAQHADALDVDACGCHDVGLVDGQIIQIQEPRRSNHTHRHPPRDQDHQGHRPLFLASASM